MNFLISFFGFAFLIIACATAPVSNRSQFNFIPESQMNAMGVEAYQEILQKDKISTDQNLQGLVTRIGNRIAIASGEKYDWKFIVIDDPKTVNAFCLPGGKVAVYSGILPIAKNEAGLAAIMGHEVAHATAHHGGERMSQGLIVQAGLTAADFAMGDSKSKGLLLAAVGAGAKFGVLLPFSRTHESEADRIGLHYMARAGYDPIEAAELWRRMAKAGGSQPPEFMSTHPSNDSRIYHLTEQADEVHGEYEKSDKQDSYRSIQ